jgi:hypothetical protein
MGATRSQAEGSRHLNTVHEASRRPNTRTDCPMRSGPTYTDRQLQAHNIGVLISAIQELGIETSFGHHS